MNPLLSHISSKHHIFDESGRPLGSTSRGLLVVWSLFLLTGFTLAVWLEPDPRGYGTHQSLGLPECSFRVLFNIPCPSCGMTTSFAYFARGQFICAAEANFAGLALAMVCALQVPWCWWSAYRGCLWKISNPEMTLLWLLLLLMGLGTGQWGFRLFVA